MTESTNWHRLFDLILKDFFTGSPFEVDSERDLSIHQQRLDILILRKRPGDFTERLPDGFENLADHNLLTFKSHQEALDDWALKELTGHYVNYRKQCSSRTQPLLPEAAFRLYAVSSRYPQGLAAQVPLTLLREGVYECRRGTDVFRVIVAGQLPEESQNALLHLFSASGTKVAYGVAHFQLRSSDLSSLWLKLLQGYEKEGIAMPYTMEDLKREVARELLEEMPMEERLRGLPPEERLRGLPPEERLRGLPPEERLRGLTAQELLRGLPPEVLEALKEQLRQDNGDESSTPKN